MLVLTRKDDQGVWINEEIFIRVQNSQAGRCSLVISAPKAYKIRRAELEKIEQKTIRVGTPVRPVQDTSGEGL